MVDNPVGIDNSNALYRKHTDLIFFAHTAFQNVLFIIENIQEDEGAGIEKTMQDHHFPDFRQSATYPSCYGRTFSI